MKIVVDLPEELTAKDKFYTDKEEDFGCALGLQTAIYILYECC